MTGAETSIVVLRGQCLRDLQLWVKDAPGLYGALVPDGTGHPIRLNVKAVGGGIVLAVRARQIVDNDGNGGWVFTDPDGQALGSAEDPDSVLDAIRARLSGQAVR